MTELSTPSPAGADPLQSAAERFLATGALERSVPLRRLFDFLLACTLVGRMPREIEVAQDVFGRTADFDVGQDASIRVQVHRLRRKLEEFRLAHPDDTTFLAIPRGEYRLLLHTAEAKPEPEEAVVVPAPAPPAAAPPHPPLRSRHRWLAAALAALVLANIAGWGYFTWREPRPPAVRALAHTTLWRPLLQSSAPTVVVVGDYYIFGEAPNATDVTRLVREFSINSRDDLDEYLMAHPDQMGRMRDLDLHYLPVGAAAALRSISPMLDAIQAHGRVRIITMSQLTPEVLKGANVIYVGFLSGLGMLRDVVFTASSLAVGDSYDELVDTRSGRHFVSDWGEIAEGRTPHRDYGYIANVPLPGGKELLVLAGTRDAALMQSAESAIEPDMLHEIERRTHDAPASEALLEVSAMGNAALAGKLMLARPIASGPRTRPTHFPDQLQEVLQ